MTTFDTIVALIVSQDVKLHEVGLFYQVNTIFDNGWGLIVVQYRSTLIKRSFVHAAFRVSFM